MSFRRVLPRFALALVLTQGMGAPARVPDLPPPARLEDVKARIEADNRNNPVKSVAWATQALAELGPAGARQDRLWFLAALSRDYNLLGRYDQALVAALQGKALVGDGGSAVERARFGILETRALVNQNPQAALKALEAVLPLLPDLARQADRSSRWEAAQGYRTQGSVHLALNHLPQAMEGYTRALRIYDELGDTRGQALSHDALAGIHSRSGRYIEAEAATRRALEIATEGRNDDLLAGFHLSLSNTYGRLNHPDQQLAELKVAHQLAEKSQDAGTALTASVNLADVSLQMKDYPATLKHAEAAMRLAEQAKDATSLTICRVNKGIALNRMGRPGGVALIEQGLEEFRKAGDQSYLPELTGILSEEYAFNHDWEKAYQAHLRFKELSDAVLKQEDQKRIAQAQAAYQSDKKQREIEALQKDQRNQARFRLLWMLAGLLGISAAGILVVGRKRLQKANKALEDMALRDPLTGLANRRYLTTRIDEDLAHIKRLHRLTAHPGARAADRLAVNIDVVFMMLDIDHFKQVNDTHGHAAGDLVLRQFSGILTRTLRDSDTVVRWGGEEFFVVAKHTSRSDAHLLAERIRKAVADHPFDVGEGTRIHKTCSIGFACYPFIAESQGHAAWETIAEMADQCLYAAKFSGRNMWVGIRPCDLAPEALAGSLQSWVDVGQCVKEGLLQAQCTEGRTLSWPD